VAADGGPGRARGRWLGLALVLALGICLGIVARGPGRLRPGSRSGYVYGTVVAVGSATRPGRVRLRGGQVVTAQVEPPPGAAATTPSILLPRFAVGDRVQVAYEVGPGGRTTYAVTDWERLPVVLALLWVFVAAVAWVARWQGLRALAGTAASLAVLVLFVVPEILAGRDPLGVALLGAGGILALSMFVVHGFNWKTVAAVAGTAATVMLAVGLGWASLRLGHVAGFGDEETVYVAVADGRVDLPGLVLASVVVGALGALVDVTVSQASTVAELARARPDLGYGALYARGMRVGYDHIGSLVNTLALAYASSALPVLLLLRLAGTGLRAELNGELLAFQLIHVLVGGIALVLAVPATTVLAALLFAHGRVPVPAAEGAHGHPHVHA